MTPVDHMSALILNLAQLSNPKPRYTLVHTQPLQADSLFAEWHQLQWLKALEPSWQEWKKRLIQLGKEQNNHALLVLGASLNRFNQMLCVDHTYPIDHVLQDLPEIGTLLQKSPNLTPCFEHLKDH